MHNERMKTVLIAPDSFKGSLSAAQVADAIEDGVQRILPGANVMKHPVSDGGEGLLDVLIPAIGGMIRRTEVSGPLPGQRVDARWGLSSDGARAIIEMAEAAGLTLVPLRQRDPNIASTFGVGELILAALDAGARTILVGIGGSATNDGGVGLAEALGIRFLDARGHPLARGGAALNNLARIDISARDTRLDAVQTIVACDVQNTLCGNEGASAVYGPQKGGKPEDIKLLDEALAHYAGVIRSTMGIDILSISGGGAAGGSGAGFVAFCNALLKRGIDVVLDATGFDEKLRSADLVITGEGKIDEQVRFGKALSGVIERANRVGVPVVAVVGSLQGERKAFVRPSFLADVEPLTSPSVSEEEAMANASALISDRVQILLRRVLH